MTTRKYTSRSQQTTLTAAISATTSLISVSSASALLGGLTVGAGEVLTCVIDPDTALEEIIDVTTISSSSGTIVATRGVDGSSGQVHSAGSIIRHMAIGRDFREANLHIEATTGYNDGTGVHTLHGLSNTDGNVVGTLATQTLSNKTLGTDLAAGGFKITGLGTPTNANDAATKTYADSTVNAAATSAASAAASATAAATSATSAAASATAAATSATSAAASATTASNSAATATTQASNALTSANSAATSATSAAASATTASAANYILYQATFR